VRFSGIVQTFSDSAVVLLGHGSTLNSESSGPVYAHAAELRRAGLFAEVREAFWKQAPHISQVLGELKANRVFIVPMFIGEGYFSGEVIPEALGFHTHSAQGSRLLRGNQTWIYCRAVGTHASMTRILLTRARHVVEQFPFPRAPLPRDISLFIAGHGTERSSRSGDAVQAQVEILRGLDMYGCVHGVFMEQEPLIAQSYSLATTRHMVVIPFFISDGLHVTEDIPMMLGEPERIVRVRLTNGQWPWRNPTEMNGKLVWYSRSVGTEPGLTEVVLEMVTQAADGNR